MDLWKASKEAVLKVITTQAEHSSTLYRGLSHAFRFLRSDTVLLSVKLLFTIVWKDLAFWLPDWQSMVLLLGVIVTKSPAVCSTSLPNIMPPSFIFSSIVFVVLLIVMSIKFVDFLTSNGWMGKMSFPTINCPVYWP